MVLPEKVQLNDKPVKSDREGFFKLIISDLEPDKMYPIQFRWVYKDGTNGPWSHIKVIFTPEEDPLEAPEFLSSHLKSDGKNFVVTWSGLDKDGVAYSSNFKEIEVWYKNVDQGQFIPYSNKITKAGEPLAVPASKNETYEVKLRAISTRGKVSNFSDTRTIKIDSEANDPIQNVSMAWKGGDLVFTITHDLTLPNNKTLSHYLLNAYYGNNALAFTKRIEKSSSGSIHIGTFTEKENKERFGFPLKTQLYGTIETVAENGSPKNPYSWTAPSKTSTLPAPTISLSKGIGYYSVAWVAPAATLDDKVAVIVIEESSSPSGPWSQVANTSSNPVNIQSNSSTKYVRAIFYDTNDLQGQGYSSVHSITPDPVITEDNTIPAAPSSVTVTSNTLSSYEIKNGVGSISVSWTISDLSTYSKHGGVNIEYKLSTDTGYNSIFVPFTTSSPKYLHKIENLIQGLSYNIRVSSVNGNTLKQSSFTTASPSSISVLSSTSISKPKTPEAYVGLDSTNTNPGPMAVRIRQYSQKSDGTDIEKDISHFEIWAIPSSYTSANDSVAQKIGTLKAAASGGNMNYVEGNFTVNVQANTTYKFYSKAINNGGYSSIASDLSLAKSIPFISNAYISDLSADKITTGTLAATQYITIGTNTNSIKINSSSTDSDTYIRSGTGGYNSTGSGFYVDASGRFSLKNKLRFDGNDLFVEGQINATSGTISTGNLQVTTGTIIAGTPGGNRVVMNSSGISSFYGGSEVTRIVANPTAPQTSFYTSSAELGGNGTGSGGWIVNSSAITKGNVVLDASNSAIYTKNTSNTFYVGLASPSQSNDLLFWAGGPPANKASGLTFGVFSNGKVQIGSYTDAEAQLGLAGSGVAAADVYKHIGGINSTTIDGSVITTGIIRSWGYSGSFDGSSYSSNGTAINLGNSITSPSITSKNFRINQSGNAFFKGEITASAGFIGGEEGWSIGSRQIYNSFTNNNITYETFIRVPTAAQLIDPIQDPVVLQVALPTLFSVSKLGKLKASSVDLTGTIKATSGYIGGESSGWLIGSNKITSGAVELNASNGTISGALIYGGNVNITGVPSLVDAGSDSDSGAGDETNLSSASNSLTTLYKRAPFGGYSAVNCVGLNAVGLISTATAGVVSSWYPYYDGAADLGVKYSPTYLTYPYRWRNLRLTGSIMLGGDGYSDSPTASTVSERPLIRIYSTGAIYANTLNAGSGTTTGSTVVQNSSGFLKVSGSSRTLKENIIEIPRNGYLDAVMQIKPVNFNYINPEEEEPTISGLIAEDLDLIEKFRGVVNYDIQGAPMSIAYDRMGALLVLAIQEVKDRLDSIEQRLDALEP